MAKIDIKARLSGIVILFILIILYLYFIFRIMTSQELKVYEILKLKLGEKEAETVMEFIEEKTEEKINQKKDVFLTKDDKVDMIKWMVGFWIAQMAAIIGLYIKS